jgi:hypothetical protein
MGFRSIQGIWREHLKWDDKALDILCLVLKRSSLEGAWNRVWNYGKGKGVDIYRDNYDVSQEVIVRYIEEKAKDLKRPGAFIALLRRAVTHAFTDSGTRNPCDGHLLSKYTRMCVVKHTKVARQRKGLIPILTFLARTYQKYGHPDDFNKDLLRTTTCVMLCLVKMFWLGDIYKVGREDIVYEKKDAFMILSVLGNKVDQNIEGSTECIWKADTGFPFDPVRMWRRYEAISRRSANKFNENRQFILTTWKEKKTKQSEELARQWETRTPMFFVLKGDR